MTDDLTASEVCAATGCAAPTLRAWRNRNGLFPRHAEAGGWTRYDLADAIGVALVMALTARGTEAQAAVNLVNALRSTLEQAAHGNFVGRLGVGRSLEGSLEFRIIRNTDLVPFDYFDDPIVTVINLQAIAWKIIFAVRQARGLGPIKFIFDDGEDAK